MTKFQISATYATRSIGDWNCIYSFEIISRTEKTVTISVHGRIVSRRISVNDNVETFKPFGSYSMAAVISADKTLAQVSK
jgi:hypothetical protein